MNEVLVISFFYPPYDCTASVEASKFTKFLPRYGWQPYVLSANSDFPTTLPLEIDPARIHRASHIDVNWLPKKVSGRHNAAYAGYVTDAGTLRGRALAVLGRWYRQIVDFPDGQIGWAPFALRRGRQLMEQYEPAAVLSGAWPVTNHIVASRLSKEFGVPWVADFRDLWTDNHWFRRARLLQSLEKSIERRVLSQASAFTAPSDTWVSLLQEKFGKPAWVVPNAFDPDDYPDTIPTTNKFTLTYTGMYYPGQQDASPLITAIARLKEKKLITPESFQLRFVGRYLEYLRPALASAGVMNLVSLRHSLPHREALRLQKESSALLMLLWSGSSGRGWYSAKVYEYIGSGNPILAIGDPNSKPARLIHDTGTGRASRQIDEIKNIILSWHNNFHETGHVDRDYSPHGVEQLMWREAVARLATVLNEAAGGSETAIEVRAANR